MKAPPELLLSEYNKIIKDTGSNIWWNSIAGVPAVMHQKLSDFTDKKKTAHRYEREIY